MGFFSAIFGGPSQEEKRLAGNQSILATQMSQAFQKQFADQGQILKNLTNQLTPIANLGPNQQGFSPQELAAMNTQAINSSGAAARNAQQRVAGTLAGQGAGMFAGEGGGSSSGLVSGIQQQIQGTIASNSANQLADAQNQITQANYETGRKNFWDSTTGEQTLAHQYNPAQFGDLASGANQLALKNEGQIQAEKRQAINSAVGLGLGVLTGPVGGMISGGFKAGISALGGMMGGKKSSDTGTWYE